MKETFYFPHDYGARNDPKLQKLLRELGHEGKSVFWDIIEMLFENGGRLELAECDSYAFALRTQCDIIKRVVSDFNLFQNDGVFFWSNSVLCRLKDREERSEKARKSAEKRWYNANAMRTQCEGNAKKERKERKERKEKEIKGKEEEEIPRSVFIIPSLDEIISEFKSKGSTESEALKFFNFYESKGWVVGKTKMKKWKNAVSGWISRSKDFGEKKQTYETNTKLPAYKPYEDKTKNVKRESMPKDIKSILQGLSYENV